MSPESVGLQKDFVVTRTYGIDLTQKSPHPRHQISITLSVG